MEAAIASKVVHGGRHDFESLGVHAPPLDRSTTYPVRDLSEGARALRSLADGAATATSPVYGRLHNPTVARWEDAVATLELAETAVAFGSGMAAITAVLLAAGAPRGNVVAVRPLYGGTDHLLSAGLLGNTVTWSRPDRVARAIRDDTVLVIVETPGNPTLTLVDIYDIVVQAHGVPVAVDNTFATPILQQPLAHGATYSISSATKFLGGHGDVTAGVVACDEEAAAGLRQVRILTGALLDPQAAWLLHRSMPTLALRVQAAQVTATELATRLAAHPAVAAVHHPSLSERDPLGLVGRQMSGPGAMVAFDLHGGFPAAERVMCEVQMVLPAVSLGSVDSLIQHPAGLTHQLVNEHARAAHGVGPGLLRLSVGLEDVDDLWRDLERALDAVVTTAVASADDTGVLVSGRA